MDILLERLQRHAVARPEKVAFTFLSTDAETVSRTYRELEARALRYAMHIQHIAAPGERVLLLYPSGLDFIEAFLGCLRAGVVAVPAYPPEASAVKATLPRLRGIVEDCAPSVALAAPEIYERRAALCREEPVLGTMRWASVSDDDGSTVEAWLPPVAASAPAFLQYTSGSTARPKGVVVSHRNIVANHRFIESQCGLGPEDVCVGWLPLYHDMGLIGNVLLTIYTGMSCVWMSPLRFLHQPARWLRAISQYRGTYSGGPNFAYDLCASRVRPEQSAGLDLRSWRVAFNGAEPIRAETLERFAGRFAGEGFRRESFFPCYGLAENTLMVSGSLGKPTLKTLDRRAYETGQVVDSTGDAGAGLVVVASGSWDSATRVEIVEAETGELCPPGRVGEIWVAGASVAEGYWGAPESTLATFGRRLLGAGEASFLRTGDLGFLADGQVYVTGRSTDVIIARGRKIHAEDVEATVLAYDPALRPGSVAAFGFETGGEDQLVVVVAIDLKRAAAVPHLLGAIRQCVSEVHETPPHAILLVRPGSFPKTSSGKIQRSACKKAFFDRSFQVVAEWTDLPGRVRPLDTTTAG
jgi:acyl-CoA synthetase (AMP-forming)/AMP-acid ligase II